MVAVTQKSLVGEPIRVVVESHDRQATAIHATLSSGDFGGAGYGTTAATDSALGDLTAGGADLWRHRAR